MKTVFKERFKKYYPNKRLLAVHLNGFSHSIFMDDGTAESSVQISRVTCAPEQRDGNTNTPEAKKFFEDYPNYKYQNNAKEIIFVTPDER